jgi:hypothetical protein
MSQYVTVLAWGRVAVEETASRQRGHLGLFYGVLKIRAEVSMQSAGAGYRHSLGLYWSGVPYFDTTASWRSVRSLYGWGNINK